MSGQGTRISTFDDFPTLAVYEHMEPAGKIYTVAFKNLEYDVLPKGFTGCLMQLIFAVVFMSSPFIAIWIMAAFQSIGVHWVFSLCFVIAAFVAMFNKLKVPWSIDRTIELDTGTGALRVLKKGCVEVERPYKRMANLTVEDHPDAEFKRADRQQRGEKGLKNEEKQHCLIGWFGEGGAEQVILIYRAEWPSRKSLFEVRQAILWAKTLAEGAEAPNPFRAGPDTIKPPLD